MNPSSCHDFPTMYSNSYLVAGIVSFGVYVPAHNPSFSGGGRLNSIEKCQGPEISYGSTSSPETEDGYLVRRRRISHVKSTGRELSMQDREVML